MAKVSTTKTHMVKPAKKTWTGKMKLSELDLVLSKAFVYSLGTNNRRDPPSISLALRESLGRAVVDFYPFLGRLRSIGGGRVELVVDDEDEAAWGVPFVEAGAGIEVAELGDFAVAKKEGRLDEFFPKIDYSKPIKEMELLRVKLTHFRCGGVAVGFSWSHAVVDGVGAAHFYSQWTRYCRGEECLGTRPLHDRSNLRAGEPPISVPNFIPLDVESTAPPPPPSPTTTLKFPISNSQLKTLKQIADTTNNTGRPYTRFEVLTAHAWRCAAKARNQNQNQNAIAIAVDIRKRVNPPLPEGFTGNAVLAVSATSGPEDDLASGPLGHTCGKIRETVGEVSGEFAWACLEYQKGVEELGACRGVITPQGRFVNPDVVIVSWLNLKFHGLDFGWGKEVYMASSPQSWEGVGCLLDGASEGEAVVVMCLKSGDALKFEEFFFDGLN